MTLPVPALHQWLVKLVTALASAFVCAILIPIVVVFTGHFVLGFRLSDPGVTLTRSAFSSTILAVLPLLLISVAAFWCACAVKDTVFAALLVFPVVGVLSIAIASGTAAMREMALIPTVLLALIQSYRLFRTEAQNPPLLAMRHLLPLAVVAFLCSLFLDRFK